MLRLWFRFLSVFVCFVLLVVVFCLYSLLVYFIVVSRFGLPAVVVLCLLAFDFGFCLLCLGFLV